MGKINFLKTTSKKSLTKKDSKYWDALSQMVTECEMLRLRHNLSQKDLAARMGTTQSVISRFENMGRTPNYDFIVRLADALDCTVNIVFETKDTETVKNSGNFQVSSVSDVTLTLNTEQEYTSATVLEKDEFSPDNLAA